MISRVLLALLAASQQTPSLDHIRDVVQKRLDQFAVDNPFPGCTAAVVLPDGRSLAFSVGYSDLDTKRKMEPTDRMLAGSIGKTFFAATIMELCKEGKVSLDDKISKYLGDKPWFNRVPNAADLTVRNLMNHQSGVPEYVERHDVVLTLLKDPDKAWTPEELVGFTFDQKPLFPAGTDWSYADANYVITCAALEPLLEKGFLGEIDSRFLKPLGLTRTEPSNHRKLEGLVQGYSMEGSPFDLAQGAVLKDGELSFNPQFEWAGGGFISNSEDLARWCYHLFRGDVLGKEWTKTMSDGVKAKLGPTDTYGFAAMGLKTPIGWAVGHEGWYPGYLSEMRYWPEQDIAVAVQFNTDDFKKLKHRTRYYTSEIAAVVAVALKGG